MNIKKNKYSLNKLYIDCEAIVENYKSLMEYVGSEVICAATLKANAYGLGATPIMINLSKAGCNKFFVTSLDEALELRQESLTDEIYVLNGIFPGEEDDIVYNNIIPVINSKEQFELYNNYCLRKNKRLPAIINIDIGINRLGFSSKEAFELLQQDYFNQKIDIYFIMSYLSFPSIPDHPNNKKQLSIAKKLQHAFNKPLSLVDSAGISLGPEYYSDIIRPGIMLYGINTTKIPINLKPAISITSSIIHIKEVHEDSFIGDCSEHSIRKGTILATIPIGYANGLHCLTNTSQNKCYINNKPAPIVGRSFMDLIVLDVTKIPKKDLYLNAEVEIIGKNATFEDIKEYNSMSFHEILTSLGSNLQRFYQHESYKVIIK